MKNEKAITERIEKLEKKLDLVIKELAHVASINLNLEEVNDEKDD